MKTEMEWLDIAETQLGVKRTRVGNGNPQIIEYWKTFKMSGIKNEAVPWCSAFIGYCLEKSGINTNSTNKDIYKKRTKDSSQYWLVWDGGYKLKEPMYGCIAVMERSGGGHVGFLIGEDKDHWVLLGGNQGSAVSIAKFPKDKFIGFVLPKGYTSDKVIPNTKADKETKLH